VLIKVDHERCSRVSEILRRVKIPLAREEGSLSGLRTEDIPNFYFFTVAICHQTTPQGGLPLLGVLSSGRKCSGWDYLRLRFAERVAEEKEWLTPRVWSTASSDDLERLFTDASGAMSLTACPGRASLIRDLGSRCLNQAIASPTDLYIQTGGRLVGGSSGGLYSALSQFCAYGDPVKKKSCFFLELMRNEGGWVYADPEELGAPVDYHEVRGHLRLGTVIVEDASLLECLRNGTPVDERRDRSIRSAVYEAINRISSEVGNVDPATLHYLFWNVFRNCCKRDTQHCTSCGSACQLPERYRMAFEIVDSTKCVFSGCCRSAGLQLKLNEHVHETEYY